MTYDTRDIRRYQAVVAAQMAGITSFRRMTNAAIGRIARIPQDEAYSVIVHHSEYDFDGELLQRAITEVYRGEPQVAKDHTIEDNG